MRLLVDIKKMLLSIMSGILKNEDVIKPKVSGSGSWDDEARVRIQEGERSKTGENKKASTSKLLSIFLVRRK